MHVSPLRLWLGRRPPLSLALWLPLAAFALLLGATAAAAQTSPYLTITGLEYDYIDGATWVEGDQVVVYVEEHPACGPSYKCH